MRLKLGLLIWLQALISISALEETEAGAIDWHKEFVGAPITDSLKTLPAFIRSDVTSPKKKTGIAVVTKSNVLAVVNPGSTGNLVWRRAFDKSEGPILQYKSHRDALATLSGPGGSHVRLFEAFTGALLWERQLHPPSSGRLLEPPSIGVDVAFWRDVRDIDAYVLTNAHTVTRLEGRTGKTMWSWTTIDISVLISRVVLSDTTVFAVGLAKTDTYALNVITLDRETGALISQHTVPSRITRGLQDVFVLQTRNTLLPAVAWFDREAGALHSVILDSPDTFKPKRFSTKHVFAHVHDAQVNENGLFVADTKDGSSYIIGMESAGLVEAWEFSDSARSKHETPSSFSGGTDREGYPYIARLFWSHTTQLAHVHIYAARGSGGQGLVMGSTFPFQTSEHGIITHCAIDVFMPHEHSVQHRLFITTSTGAVQLWQGQDLQWTRDEALAEIALATLVDLPERKIAAELSTSEHRGFQERLWSHIIATQHLPQYVVQFSKRFATGSYATASSTGSPSTSLALERDAFGFRKVLVVATSHGTLLGLDTAQGSVVWRRIVGVSSTGPADIIPYKMFLVKSAVEGPNPEIVLVAEKRSRGKDAPSSVVFHFEALTGKLLGNGRTSGRKISDFGVAEAFTVPGDASVVGVVSTDGQINLYPTTPGALKALDAKTDSLHLALRTGSELHGYSVQPRKSAGSSQFPTLQTWSKSFHPQSSLNVPSSPLDIIHRPATPLASYGKVLGDRTTLYKYLNPHAAVVIAQDCAVRVVDLVSGAIVFDSGALVGCGTPKVAFTENWLVYAHEVGGNATDKGTRIVSVELYEGSGKDDKTSSPDVSSFSEKSARVHAIQQSFIFPYPIAALGTTSTKFGISTKGLLVATTKNQVYHLHRRMLDPRRPMQKPNAEEQEEMLVQYDAVVPPDPRRVITHKNQVLGVQHLLTAPTLLESTSCVLAYGLDLFHTRVTPSGTFDLLGSGFNKVQLVLTIVGLSVAIVVVRPLVARKQLHARWYA